MGTLKDLTGLVFGQLTVKHFAGVNSDGKRVYLCYCACGCQAVVRGVELTRTSKPLRSCGCLQRQKATTHGLSKTVEYRLWRGMWSRCTNKKMQAYKNYGGRGITVCEQWRTFSPFLADMGVRPLATSIERRDNDKGYTPDNCYWATAKEQGRNKRTNRRLTLDGRTQTLAAWAEQLGIKTSTLGMRLATGWSTRRALTTPVQVKRRRI